MGRVISDRDWNRCCAQVKRIPFTYRHKLIQFKFLHQFHYTPQQIYRFDSTVVSKCARCGCIGADFMHMFWQCPNLYTYWAGIFETISAMIGEVLAPDEYVAPLGDVHSICGTLRRFVAVASMLAKRKVGVQWMARVLRRRLRGGFQTWCTV